MTPHIPASSESIDRARALCRRQFDVSVEVGQATVWRDEPGALAAEVKAAQGFAKPTATDLASTLDQIGGFSQVQIDAYIMTAEATIAALEELKNTL